MKSDAGDVSVGEKVVVRIVHRSHTPEKATEEEKGSMLKIE